ncbi:hypothetical protein [Stenotrophomonas maltophilia]|uniref:Uncharacterized protein n=1 Tax=Stenotrophomonas maltophilia TaxID=40324 RepID=A0A4S2D279_STEMA|nr:hypothetical protein [Stenotrophomonas maltophilia]TGY35236.1 hypothetical protein E5352_05815 [Stenotrophomonas maltophilia]
MRHLSITYQGGLTQTSRSLRELLLVQVQHNGGVVAVAGKMDLAPSKLSEKLAGGDTSGKPRGMTIDELERYIKETGDMAPVHYLVEKFLTCPDAQHAEAIAQFANLARAMAPLAQSLGIKWP